MWVNLPVQMKEAVGGGEIMGFRNTLLLLGMRARIFGRRRQHVAFSSSQIYTLTKDFSALGCQRATESVTQSLNRTETWLVCLDPLGDAHHTTVPPTQCLLIILPRWLECSNVGPRAHRCPIGVNPCDSSPTVSVAEDDTTGHRKTLERSRRRSSRTLASIIHCVKVVGPPMRKPELWNTFPIHSTTRKTVWACIWHDWAHTGQTNWILVIKKCIKTCPRTPQAAECDNVVPAAKLFITWKGMFNLRWWLPWQTGVKMVCKVRATCSILASQILSPGRVYSLSCFISKS